MTFNKPKTTLLVLPDALEPTMRLVRAPHLRFPRILGFLSTIFLSIAALMQTASGQSPSSPPQPPPPPAEDQEQFISYWTTETGWRTELQLRNNQVGHDLVVTPVLRAADGTETSLSPVTIQSKEVKTLDVTTAIGSSAPQLIGTFGSLALRYHSPSQGNLYGVSMVMGVGHPIAFHIDATGEDQAQNIGSREGIWWLPNGTADDYLILANQGQDPLQVGVSLYDAGGKTTVRSLTLPPRGLNRLPVRQLVASAGLAGSYGGIKISALTHAGSLDSLHVLFDEKAGFSAVLKMFDYDPTTQIKERDFAGTGEWTLRAPMLALSDPDPALGFPVGTVLHPQFFVRNTTSKPIEASLMFNWRSDAASGKAPDQSLHLSPNETRRIDVAALQSGKTLPQSAQWASVTLTTNALPGEVVAVAASYDESWRYGAQTPFSDQLAAYWAGGQWQYDAEHDSIITVGNGGLKPTQAAFTIFYNEGTQKYQLEQTLQPGEQMWMDIGKLIRESVPDKTGKPLPSDLTSGSYEARDLTNKGVGTLFEGKVIYDKTYGHVTYGCAGCCGDTTPVYLYYNPISVAVGGLAYDGVLVYNTCDSGTDDVSDSFWNDWTSGNTSIVTINAYGAHSGMSAGSTTSQTAGVLAMARPRTCYNQPFTPNGGVNVTPPMTLSCSPSSVARGSSVTCTVNNPPSGAIFSSWQFTDSNNNVVNGSNATSSWSGVIVTSGTVRVKVFATPLSASITVTNRNWHTAPASPGSVPNGTFFVLDVPPQPIGSESGLGISLERTGNNPSKSTFISSDGPNNGYGYYPTLPIFTSYQYELNPDLENSASTFSQHQCGNYNASSNPSGFISWLTLSTQTSRHEYNSTVQSHYAFYSNSISRAANNPGD